MDGRSLWLVLPDPFPTRVFADCGIVARLWERVDGRMLAVLVLPPDEVDGWAQRLAPVPFTAGVELAPWSVGSVERVARKVDALLDRELGFYPLALRHSLRHAFHGERMRPGHRNTFLDPSQLGHLPRWRGLEGAMMRWHFSTRRYVPSALLERMRSSCSGVVVANLQSRPAVPYLLAARRLGLPVVGYVASWDHTVGKGVVSPHLDRYVVQNGVMHNDLVRYHGIPSERIAVTGWPQTDVFHRRRRREDYEATLTALGLDPARPVALVAGNTPTNAPYEAQFVERVVRWWQESGGAARLSLLFRPHPRDVEWRERFAAAAGVEGAAVQEPSYTDIETLATVLQHVDCVVANAGTILLDALVNDRPAVCVLYDEGAPAGERWAELNVTGAHYRELMESEAFYRARAFEEVVDGIDRALARPGELGAERARVAREVVGEVDGRAADRVVDAIVAARET